MSTQSFILAVHNAHGGWQKIGFIALAKQCKADAAVKGYFNPGSRAYNDALKSCRWLAGEPAAMDVIWEHPTRPALKFRTIKIGASH
jgi:hypothetical protein